MILLKEGQHVSIIGNIHAGAAQQNPRDSRLATVAVTMSALSCAALAISYSIFFVAWAVNGEDGVSDNWVGFLAAYTLLGSIALTLISFVVGLFLWRRHNQHPLLWLTIYLFPTLAVVTLLVEFFVIE